MGTICLSILRPPINPFAPSIFGFDRFLHGVEGAAVALGGTLGALEKEKLRMRRVRPPRVFADPSLKVYNQCEIEEGDEILSRVSNGKYWEKIVLNTSIYERFDISDYLSTNINSHRIL